MRSIDLGKKFLGLALCFALSSSVVLANTLSEVQINADETSGYDIVLKTDSATEMKKVVSDDNKMYIELKNVQASDSLNTVYNNVANIENVTIQPVSKEDLKITFKGEGIAKSKIYFENIKTAPLASVSSEQETIELNKPMNTYSPVYNPNAFPEEIDQTANPKVNEILTNLNIDRAAVVSAKGFAKKVINKGKNAASGFDLNTITLVGIMFIAAALFLRPKNKKENVQKIGLSQTNINREVSMNADMASKVPQKLNPMMPASAYGVKAYQQSQKNPYMTTNVMSNGISGIPRKPLAHPKPVTKKPVLQQSVPVKNTKNVTNNTIRDTKPVPSAKKNMDPSDIDSMKFLETITKIYEKNGRNDLAKGLKDNLKKAQMAKY